MNLRLYPSCSSLIWYSWHTLGHHKTLPGGHLIHAVYRVSIPCGFVVCSALNEGRSLTHLVLIMTVVNIPNTSESADFREVHLFVMFGIVDLASVIIALTEASRYPGGGTQVQRGVAPALRISRKGSFFKTSACPRFCKRRVLFCTQVRSMGVKIPLQSTKYMRFWRRVTPEVTGLPSLLPPLAAAKQAEDYKILT